MQQEYWKCQDRDDYVGEGDGCTMGDDLGQTIGCVPYEIDLSMTQPQTLEWY